MKELLMFPVYVAVCLAESVFGSSSGDKPDGSNVNTDGDYYTGGSDKCNDSDCSHPSHNR